MKKHLVVEIFNEIADILEILGENAFRVRAYRRAALHVSTISENIVTLVEEGTLTEIDGVGKDLARKITEIVTTGSLKYYKDLKSEVPQGVIDMLSIQGIGPRTAKLIYEHLDIATIEDLERAAKKHMISGLPSIKDKTEDNILKGISLLKKGKERMTLDIAWNLADSIVHFLSKIKEVKKIDVAGSVRRRKETVKDIDILIASKSPDLIMKAFTSMENIDRILAFGPTKSSVLLSQGIQVDLRVVNESCYGAALLYFTGSKEHNVHLRRIAKLVGLKINEYGVFEENNEVLVAGKTEEDIYKAIDLSYIEPDLREDRGEVQASHQKQLPVLITESDIKGDFHIHTNNSDGHYSIEEVIAQATKKGYSYIAITDHSQSLAVAKGMKPDEIKKQIQWIREFNARSKGIKLLAGCELEIKSDGSVDYDESILSQLDVVIAAVHTSFSQSCDKMTKRIIKGLSRSNCINVLAHPTGRLIHGREPYDIDLDKILAFCVEHDIFVEINSYPLRLDLDDVGAKRVIDLGGMLVLSSDAHSLVQMENIKYGVSVARRGWCEKKDILNTFSYKQVLEKLYLRRKKSIT